MRFLCLGYGSIGHTHTELLRAMGHTVITLDLFSPDADEKQIEKTTVRHFDGALVCLHPKDRDGVVGDILHARWDIGCWFIEKPVTPLYGVLEAMTGFCYRWVDGLESFRDSLARRRVYSLSLVAGAELAKWHQDTDYRHRYHGTPGVGGVINDSLPHSLYVARWLLGELEVVGSVSGRLSGLDIQTEDTAAVLLQSSMGIPCYVLVDYMRDPGGFHIQAVTSEGLLSWIFSATSIPAMYKRQMAIFCERAAGRLQYGFPTLEDGLVVNRMCDAVRGGPHPATRGIYLPFSPESPIGQVHLGSDGHYYARTG